MRVRILGIAAFILAFTFASIGTAHAQTLTWDANTEPDITGYVVSIGNRPGTYSKNVDVGSQTSYSLTSLDPTLDYYFAVRAYNSQGLYSNYSSEISLPAIAPRGTTVINSFQASTSYPVLAGTPITWSASATSKRGAVEYAFWLYSSGSWVKVQDYSSNPSFMWAPRWSDRGIHAVQVWARTVGSPASYEAWVGTDLFNVTTTPLQLTASTDFPVPPGQPITWTAAMASVPAGIQLEYEFWTFEKSTGAWTKAQSYGPENEFTWTPSTTGTYGVQVWARQVGSSSEYDIWTGSDPFTVGRAPVVVTSFTPDTSLPATTGTTITWTARARGGSAGPLQYAFWRFRTGVGWTKVQDYSTSNTYTWTPTWGDEGKYALQVWVRSAGSTEDHEGWSATPAFEIQRAAAQLTSSVLFPAAPGTPVTWTASVSDSSAPVEYSFWVYDQMTGTWTNSRPYSPTATFTWTPSTGRYGVQVWARRIGSSEDYETWRGTEILTIAPGAPKVMSLRSTTASATAGSTMTWTALATGGTAGPLQYKFWVYDGTSWTMVQNYSTSNVLNWTPSSPGQYAIQVWVRSAGASSEYEAWLGSGFFMIQ
jgi:hypothetical protein